MDDEYFLNAGILPSFDFGAPLMPSWQTLSSTPEFNCFSGKVSDCYTNQNCDKSAADHYPFQFESGMTSMASSSLLSNSTVPNDNFAIRELIGKLGAVCNSGDTTAALLAAATSSGTPYSGGGNDGDRTSCFNTPTSNTPLKPQVIMDQLQNKGNSLLPGSPLPSLSGDPGFADRAAKFSFFGSRSFNGRTSPLGLKNHEVRHGSHTPLMESGTLPRVSSSPSFMAGQSAMETNNFPLNHMEMCSGLGSDKKLSKLSRSAANSNDESSVSDKKPCGYETPNELNPRKRKSISRGKAKEDASLRSGNSEKAEEANEDSNAKRPKSADGNGDENGIVKTEENSKGYSNDVEEDGQRDVKTNSKPPEPPKDYIHVRARRGQATDSHSLAERVRREKISERMKLLQDLVPGCNKVTGKALMLDEIINYVQSLQRQVEFLSMKLASVNTRLDLTMDGSINSKDVCQQNVSLSHPMLHLDSLVSGLYAGHLSQQCPQVDISVSNGALSLRPLNTTLCHKVAELGEALNQLPFHCEDDLQSVVQMGLGRKPRRDSAVLSQSFSVPNLTSCTKHKL